MKNHEVFSSPLGNIRVDFEGGAVTGLTFTSEECTAVNSGVVMLVQWQLTEYFAGERREFDFPCVLRGTDFQTRVWQALCEIPYGETRSYGQIAAQIGSPGAARAVGMANHNNPICIAVPCHRVIGADGSAIGYACGVEIKKKLLELEQKYR